MINRFKFLITRSKNTFFGPVIHLHWDMVKKACNTFNGIDSALSGSVWMVHQTVCSLHKPLGEHYCFTTQEDKFLMSIWECLYEKVSPLETFSIKCSWNFSGRRHGQRMNSGFRWRNVDIGMSKCKCVLTWVHYFYKVFL